MNKHIETLMGFKKGSKKIWKEQFYELWNAFDELVSAFKKIGYAFFVLLVWIFSLCIIIFLPIATYLRIKWQKQAEVEYNAEVERIQNAYKPVERDSGEGERN